MQSIPGPSVPQHEPIAPYSGTDIFASVSGRWLLWTFLVFLLPATLSVYSDVNGILSVLTLIPAIAVNVIGICKSWKARVPGYRKLYLLSFLLGLPITIGVYLQLEAVSKTGDAEGSTSLAWFSMLAMFIVASIALVQAANINPYSVSRRIRITVNSLLALLIGTTIASPFLFILIIMLALVFVGGWYTVALFMAVPVAIIIVLVSLLVRRYKAERKFAQDRHTPGKLISLKTLFMYSGIVACMTYISVGIWATLYILSGGSFSP